MQRTWEQPPGSESKSPDDEPQEKGDLGPRAARKWTDLGRRLSPVSI